MKKRKKQVLVPEALKLCLRTWFIAEKIFNNLSFKELWNLKAVSTEFDRSVEIYLPYLQDFDTSDYVNGKELKTEKKCKKIKCNKKKDGDEIFLDYLHLFNNLRRVRIVLDNDDVKVALFDQLIQLMERNKKITEIHLLWHGEILNFQNVNQNVSITEQLLLGHPRLEKLKFESVEHNYYSGVDEAGRLMMTRKLESFIKKLTSASPRLVNLKIDLVVNGLRVRYDDACLEAAAANLMQSIHLGRESRVTKESVMRFIDASPNLREFDFSSAYHYYYYEDYLDVDEVLVHLAENCPDVVVLDLKDTTCSGDALVYAITRLTGLQKVTCYCRNAREIVRVFQVMTSSLKDVKHLHVKASCDGYDSIAYYLTPFFEKFTSLQSFGYLTDTGDLGYLFLMLTSFYSKNLESFELYNQNSHLVDDVPLSGKHVRRLLKRNTKMKKLILDSWVERPAGAAIFRHSKTLQEFKFIYNGQSFTHKDPFRSFVGYMKWKYMKNLKNLKCLK